MRKQSKGPKQQPASTRSMLAMKIVKTALKPDVTVAELATLAQSDPAFAVRLLSVVNSASSSVTSRVDDVGRAAVLVGISGMKSLALGMSVVDRAPAGPLGARLLGLCLRRAMAAKLIALELGMRAEADDCFTAGLLCELGMLAHASDDLEATEECANEPAEARIVRERVAGLVPHPARGAELAHAWQLGDALAGAIEHHHDLDPPDPTMWRICWVAERVAAVFEGVDVEATEAEAANALRQVRLEPDVLERMIATLPDQVRDAARGYEVAVEQEDADALVRDANARLVDLNRHFQVTLRRLEAVLAEKELLTEKLAKANRELERMASIDGLTRLLNRRAFNDALRRDLNRASRAGEPVSLVMIDVDHFKRFNDTYGHQAGDAVLRFVGRLLGKGVRTGDVPARYGGEEFAVILPRTDEPGAALVAERIRERLAASEVDIGGKVVGVTASLGVATISGPGCHEQAEALIGAADAALYVAKDGGRNAVRSAPARIVAEGQVAQAS